MVGVGFRDCGSRPGIVQIDDGDDRCADVDYFSLACGAHGNGSAHRRIDVGIAQSHRGLIILRDRIVEVGLGSGHGALRGIGLMGARHGGVQVGFRGLNQFLLRLNDCLGRLQVGLRLHALLIRRDSRLSQFDSATAVTRGAVQLGLCLKQLCLRRRQLGLRVRHIARSGALGRFFRVLHFRDFMLQAGDGRCSRSLLRLQFGGVEHGDEISGFDRRALIHQQLLDAAADLRTHDHLVRIDRADQHQVPRVVGGQKVVGRGNHKDDSEKDKKFITRAHERAPCVAWRCFLTGTTRRK